MLHRNVHVLHAQGRSGLPGKHARTWHGCWPRREMGEDGTVGRKEQLTAHLWRIPPVLAVSFCFYFLNFFSRLPAGIKLLKRIWNIQDVPLRVFFSSPRGHLNHFLLAFDCSCVVGGRCSLFFASDSFVNFVLGFLDCCQRKMPAVTDHQLSMLLQFSVEKKKDTCH